MPFKGLTDKFEQRQSELWNRYSAKTSDSIHPILEFKPDNPNRNETKNDSTFNSFNSEKRNLQRINVFLRSPAGIRFLVNQAELQAGNTFSETRLYNPAFVFGTIPFTKERVARPLGTAKGTGVGARNVQAGVNSAISSVVRGVISGESQSDEGKSPASDDTVGAAGRLQKATAKSVVNKVLGKTGPLGLLNLIPPNNITRAMSGVLQITQTGILGVNERPELNVDKQFYSIALWSGFRRNQPKTNNFIKAGVDLRKGNLKGAVTNLLKGAGRELLTQTIGTKANPVSKTPQEGRNDPARTDLSGLRYFIVNKQDADRYLDDSVVDGKSQTEFLDRRPYKLSGKSVLFTKSDIISIDDIPSGQQLVAAKEKIASQIQSKQRSITSKIGGFVRSTTQNLLGPALQVSNKVLSVGNRLGIFNFPFSPTDPFGKPTGLLNDSIANNPAQERLLFNDMSLANQYDNATGNVDDHKKDLDEQQTEWLENIRQLKTNPTYGLGYLGGLQPGYPIADTAFAMKRTKVPGGRYLSDGAAQTDAILDNKDVANGERRINPDLKNLVREVSKDVIDFMFHDYVNNKVIPFRAIISTIAENTTADVNTQRYIGRTERNIVYVGAERDLTFTFMVQAFSKFELDFIWQKINYLTGLCFPSKYSEGFMLPPFVQLTIGNLYVDQPGFIKSISHTIDESTSWDIDRNSQIPMGLTITVNFGIIEKAQIKAGYGFYGFGEPRTLG